MNIVLDINTIKKNNVFFCESVKNTVINNSNFIRIIYSNNEVMMNGLYIKFDINKKNYKNTIIIIIIMKVIIMVIYLYY